MGLMTGKTVVVTGASTGLGKASMATLAREGANIVASARTKDKLEAAVAEITAAGGSAIAVAADMSDDAQVGKVIDAAVAEFGRVDALVNNAGVGYGYRAVRPNSMLPIVESPLDEWEHVMGINLNSVVFASRRALPIMIEQGSGSIVNVASILGMVGHHDAHAYTTAKGAIINLTRSMAKTYGPLNIRSNVLAPGFIDTPMIAEYTEYLNAEETRNSWGCPMGRTGTPDEIANAVLYLTSDLSSYTNGLVMAVDGGFTAC
ncbi:MAG: SDR family NAD(P)-dependent oxidoreductase [Actinobacteria bacterium]|nr:SDR family NAD(P)-dependent oxidoreductase [Actinomycetota bacterium]